MKPFRKQFDAVVVIAHLRRALAKAHNLEQLKLIHDEAEAVRQYAKSAALGLKSQNAAAEVRLLAARRMGDLVGSLHLRGGNHSSKPRLSDSGLSRNTTMVLIWPKFSR